MRDRVFAAAALGAQSNGGELGFRQKDMMFFLGLFLHWLGTVMSEEDRKYHGTQVMRYLQNHQREGLAEELNGKPPRYVFRRAGLLKLVETLTEETPVFPGDQFYFSYFFVSSYRQRLIEMVGSSAGHYPASLRIELETLLDVNYLVEKQIRGIEGEIRLLENRIEVTRGALKETVQSLGENIALEKTVNMVGREFPYDLHPQKPMNEFLAEFPRALQIWELTEGNKNRIERLWQPHLEALKSHLELCRNLLSREQKSNENYL